MKILEYRPSIRLSPSELTPPAVEVAVSVARQRRGFDECSDNDIDDR